MNHRDPFTPEERELAGLLEGRVDVAPSSEADAAILAAARAALQGETTESRQAAHARATDAPRRHRRRARWPALLGVAASVVVAVGLAWQLRPGPPTPFAAVKQETVPVPARQNGPGDAATVPTPSPAAAPAAADEPVRRPAPAAAPASAPASSAARGPAPTAAADEPHAIMTAPPERALRQAVPAPLSAEDVAAAVQADATLSRRQWLQRIRSRRDAGDIDVARASLERYLLQYPGTRVPRDLQALLTE